MLKWVYRPVGMRQSKKRMPLSNRVDKGGRVIFVVSIFPDLKGCWLWYGLYKSKLWLVNTMLAGTKF